jgi:hypothetical protein
VRAAYRVTDPASGSSVIVRWPEIEAVGDPELAVRVGRYLAEDWAPALTSSYDERTEERGTGVRLVERGSWEWLRACLGQAAQELGLVMVVEIP